MFSNGYSRRWCSETELLLSITFFLTEDHHGLLEPCEITLIDKTYPSYPTRRGIYELKTFPTLELHICNIVSG